MLVHDFDQITQRRGTECKKYDTYAEDILPLWIADTDFQCPQPVIDAMVARAQHGIYGYPINAMNFNRAGALAEGAVRLGRRSRLGGIHPGGDPGDHLRHQDLQPARRPGADPVPGVSTLPRGHHQ